METLWPLHVLLVLCWARAARSHRAPQGLSCTNDFVTNVSCSWIRAPLAPGLDCWIHGAKRIWIFENNARHPKILTQSCRLKQRGTSPPGCSFIFENEEFNFFDVTNISMRCNGKLVENLTNYRPLNHIKMNPPGVPNVSSSANETWIRWTPGSPRSDYITTFDFQVQIKLKKQTWKEVSILPTQEQQLRFLTWQLKGHCQVRVRVRPSDQPGSHWSDWSPTTSWMGATTSRGQDQLPDQTPAVLGVTSLAVVTFGLFVCCMSKGRLKVKPVPNPSKYFPTLHSVHGGNLKTWLNPLSASESFFTVQPSNHISPVEVCESWDVVPSASLSSSSTSALLHVRSSAGSNTSRGVDNSSSSSCFSNMGYFMSGSSGSTAVTDPGPAYFTYQGDLRIQHDSRSFHLSLCASLVSSPAYEILKRMPESPDSGFVIGQDDEEDEKEEKVVEVEEEEGSGDRLGAPVLLLPLHPPPPPRLTPAHPPSPTQTCSDREVDAGPAAAAGRSYAAWPLSGAMCRSSSMPAEPCKTDYLTLKELQTTFSNKSI